MDPSLKPDLFHHWGGYIDPEDDNIFPLPIIVRELKKSIEFAEAKERRSREKNVAFANEKNKSNLCLVSEIKEQNRSKIEQNNVLLESTNSQFINGENKINLINYTANKLIKTKSSEIGNIPRIKISNELNQTVDISVESAIEENEFSNDTYNTVESICNETDNYVASRKSKHLGCIDEINETLNNSYDVTDKKLIETIPSENDELIQNHHILSNSVTNKYIEKNNENLNDSFISESNGLNNNTHSKVDSMGIQSKNFINMQSNDLITGSPYIHDKSVHGLVFPNSMVVEFIKENNENSNCSFNLLSNDVVKSIPDKSDNYISSETTTVHENLSHSFNPKNNDSIRSTLYDDDEAEKNCDVQSDLTDTKFNLNSNDSVESTPYKNDKSVKDVSSASTYSEFIKENTEVSNNSFSLNNKDLFRSTPYKNDKSIKDCSVLSDLAYSKCYEDYETMIDSSIVMIEDVNKSQKNEKSVQNHEIISHAVYSEYTREKNENVIDSSILESNDLTTFCENDMPVLVTSELASTECIKEDNDPNTSHKSDSSDTQLSNEIIENSNRTFNVDSEKDETNDNNLSVNINDVETKLNNSDVNNEDEQNLDSSIDLHLSVNKSVQDSNLSDLTAGQLSNNDTKDLNTTYDIAETEFDENNKSPRNDSLSSMSKENKTGCELSSPQLGFSKCNLKNVNFSRNTKFSIDDIKINDFCESASNKSTISNKSSLIDKSFSNITQVRLPTPLLDKKKSVIEGNINSSQVTNMQEKQLEENIKTPKLIDCNILESEVKQDTENLNSSKLGINSSTRKTLSPLEDSLSSEGLISNLNADDCLMKSYEDEVVEPAKEELCKQKEETATVSQEKTSELPSTSKVKKSLLTKYKKPDKFFSPVREYIYNGKEIRSMSKERHSSCIIDVTQRSKTDVKLNTSRIPVRRFAISAKRKLDYAGNKAKYFKDNPK